MDFSKTYLGIELGSTRIKAVLCDASANILAQGSFNWQNVFENGHWTYPESLFTKGLSDCYASLLNDIEEKYAEKPTTFGAIGISGMMHGYLAVDEDFCLLTPFRTWRDTTTGEAADQLTELFGENIPLRWGVSHIYQAVLNKEAHLNRLAHITTLSGYIHYCLTGEVVLGVGDAAGMFPLHGRQYDALCVEKLDKKFAEKGYVFSILDLLPKIRFAGENAGVLTAEGAALLDASGTLQAGIPFCAPEGDAATGMVAVNAITTGEGSLSAGTSAFAMLVTTEKPLQLNRNIDVVATPDGKPVVMLHANNCCGEIDAWVNLFAEFSNITGQNLSKGQIYEILYKNTRNASDDCGCISVYNFISAEPILAVEQPRPSVLRNKADMCLADFFKAQIYATISALAMSLDDFTKHEKLALGGFKASGGIFKVEGVAQQIYADAFSCPITLTDTAGEGGAWGMAILALYLDNTKMPLDKWLNESVFAKSKSVTCKPTETGIANFKAYLRNYKQNL